MAQSYNITTNSSSTTQVRILAPKDYDATDIYLVNGGLRQLKQVDGNPIVHGWVTGAPLIFNLGEDGISMYMDINDVGMSITVDSLEVGATLKLKKSDGSEVEYLIVHQGLPDSTLYDASCDGTWVLRKDILGKRTWDSTDNDYANSDIHTYLNTDFVNTLDTETKNAVKQVKIPYWNGTGDSGSISSGANGLSTNVFLLGGYEVGFSTSVDPYFPIDGAKLSHFDSGTGNAANNKRIANYNGSATGWWLRSPRTIGDGDVWVVKSDGNHYYWSYGSTYGVRPAMVLYSDSTATENNDGSYTLVGGATKPKPYSELIYYDAGNDTSGQHGILDIDNDLNFRVNKLSNDTDLTSTRYGVIKYFNKDIPEVSDYGIDRPDAEFYHVFDTENYRVMVAGKYYPPEPVNSIIVTNTTTDEQVYNGLAPTEIDAQSVVEYSNNIYILGGYAKYADGEGAGCIITSDGRMIDMPAVEVVNENAVLVGDLIFDDQYEYLLGIGHSVIDVSTPESPVGKTTTPMVMVTQALSNYNVVGQDAQGRPYQVYTYDERRADQMVIHGRSPSFSPDEYFSPSPITTDGLSEFVFLHDTSPSSDAWAFDSVVIIDGSTCDVLYEVPIDMNYNGVPQYIDKGTTRAKYWYDKTNNILYISILGVLSDDHYENYGLFQYKITF